MTPSFAKFDGSGRPPREVQTIALDWLAEKWPSRILAINGSPAVGKTGIARAIQIATGAWIVNPSNLLIDQSIATYPKVNFLKGKTHYRCSSGLTCSEWIDGLEQKACLDCPYQEAKKRALKGEPTFFNPMSLYYLLMQAKEVPKVIVVDEAHQLPATMLQLCSKRFSRSDYNFTERCQNEVHLSEWLARQLDKLRKLVALYQNTQDYDRVSHILGEIESISLTKAGLDTSPELYAIWFEKGIHRGRPETYLNVKPIKPPKYIVDKLLPCDKLILLSGTLLRTDIEEIAQDDAYEYLDLPSPIPSSSRPILNRPVSYPLNWKTPPRLIVDTLERDLADFPDRNTIIHTTYQRARQLQPLFKESVLVNTAENKNQILDEFKRRGGVFVASGCAEGIDLKGDLCRLNISPHFIRPNMGDPCVQKRKALPDGDRWYAMSALKIAIQSYGRSTRDVDDHSIAISHEPSLARVVKEYSDEIPTYYKQAIVWSGRL